MSKNIVKMKAYYILKLKNLNLEYLLNKYNPDFKFNTDFAYLVIHFVILYQSNKSSNYTRLSSKYLQKFNRIYNKHIQFLTENFPNDGAVLRGARYEKGKPFGYKLPKYYSDSELEIYAITDKSLLRKINEIILKNTTNEMVRLNYYFLLKYFNYGKLRIYEPSLAMERINEIFDKEKRLRNAKSIIKIMNGDTKLTLKPKTDGRVHSNITRLSKNARNHLQYDGEFLAEVDISSAIPFFLFLIMKYYLSNRLSYVSEEFQYDNSIIYMLEKMAVPLVNKEVDDFGDLVLNKYLYERFADRIFHEEVYTSKGYNFEKVMKYYNRPFKEQFGYYFDGDMKDLLKFAKKRLLSMLFAKTSIYKFEQLAFGSVFPQVLNFINEFKNIENNNGDTKERHKKIAYCTFQFEAKTMIDKIAREYDKIHNDKVPVFTLHDCLITTVSHVEELKDFMEKKFINLFGVAPNLTIEKSKFVADYREVS